MASGKTSKAVRNARSAVVTKRSTPWGAIIAVAVVVLFAAGVFGYAYFEGAGRSEREAALAPFTPSASNQDPARTIPGVVVQNYVAGQHVSRDKQVAYTLSPPFGGAHDEAWAACNGVVYDRPVRSETLVHSIEHGSVWIAYNPDQVSGGALDALRARVPGQPYTVMSPFPGLDQPITLSSWGHQLKLSDANDVRIDQFIQALRRNPYTNPEPQGSCFTQAPLFDQDNPPPYAPPPPPGEGEPEVSAAPPPAPGQ